ncbi:hypothetical protein E2C01_051583 [Portunus trituberculatus]|uniref:Uncharacterized protein n=1 Tax=Portunus trituberculatus TaxID=210409 RepID=A0A5B7GJA4_PORTR|nr:hypothetical protein [Portunus trituberculatus]
MSWSPHIKATKQYMLSREALRRRQHSQDAKYKATLTLYSDAQIVGEPRQIKAPVNQSVSDNTDNVYRYGTSRPPSPATLVIPRPHTQVTKNNTSQVKTRGRVTLPVFTCLENQVRHIPVLQNPSGELRPLKRGDALGHSDGRREGATKERSRIKKEG